MENSSASGGTSRTISRRKLPTQKRGSRRKHWGRGDQCGFVMGAGSSAPEEVLNQPEVVNIDNSLVNFHLTSTTILTSISLMVIVVILCALVCICLKWRLCQGCCYTWCCECCREPPIQTVYGHSQDADRAAESTLTEPSRPALLTPSNSRSSSYSSNE